MRRCLLAVFLLAGCGDSELGPFQPLPLDARLVATGLDGVVHVARDRFGIAHVYATSVADLGYVQGYVMAHDRWPQMDMLRRFASGTLAELYGVADPKTIDTDIEMRFHRIRFYAEDTWAQLKVGPDQDIVQLLERYSDGVNAYLADTIIEKRWPADPIADAAGLGPIVAPQNPAPWTPVDSIAILGFYTLAQSWSVPEELDLTAIDVALRASPRASVTNDLLALAPIANVSVGAPPTPVSGTPRPAIDPALLDAARGFFNRALFDGPAPDPNFPTLGPHAFMRPYLGSTAFVVGPADTGEELTTGKSILAADAETALSNPSVFYPMHQIIADTIVDNPPLHDVIGMMLPGVPIVVAGTNGFVGWAPTLGTADVNDVYVERLQPCATGTCSLHDNMTEPLDQFTELIQIGDETGIQTSMSKVYDVVPRHGPLIPGHPNTSALSVRSTAYATTHELHMLWLLGHAARSVGDADATLVQMQRGPQWTLIDNSGVFEWTTYADVPIRAGAAQQWSPTNPTGGAPFFVLDGNASDHEWAAEVTSRQDLPRRFGPPNTHLVIGDADPIGATFDGNPLNDPRYFGVVYANGLREERITNLIDTETRPIDTEALSRIHHDTHSVVGDKVISEVVRILAAGATGAPADAAAYFNGLDADAKARITLAHDVLEAWRTKLDTPIGKVAADASSAATLLFNTMMFYFGRDMLGDELAIAHVAYADFDQDRLVRVIYRVLADRGSLAIDPVTTEPALCSTATTNDSCWKLLLQAADAGVSSLQTANGGPDDWRWGRAHPLVMTPLFADPGGVFALPRPNESELQLSGDMFAIDRADGGWNDQDFAPRLDVAYRMLLVGNAFADPLVMKLELPTGTVFDRRDPHYRDLLEKSYVTRTPFDVPITVREINDQGESRWEFR